MGTDLNASYKENMWWTTAQSQFAQPEMSFFFTEYVSPLTMAIAPPLSVQRFND
jgi:hypothetical protein